MVDFADSFAEPRLARQLGRWDGPGHSGGSGSLDVADAVGFAGDGLKVPEVDQHVDDVGKPVGLADVPVLMVQAHVDGKGVVFVA